IDQSVAPVVLADGKSVRYAITGAFAAAGAVTATFAHGTWSVIAVTRPATVDPAAAPEVVTLGSVADPLEAFIGAGNTIVVAFPDVPAGDELVQSSLLDFNEFTLGGPGLGSVTIVKTVAPVVLADGKSVRYATSGAFAASGAVTATFTHGTWSVLP